MAAHRLTQLTCDADGCRNKFPANPIEANVSEVRENATAVGWEVMRGKHGRDVCPNSRIKEINQAMGAVAHD